MREDKNTFIHCIKADNPFDFNCQTRTFCENHNVIRITPFPDFLAYIEYMEKETVPETRLEKMEMVERHTCAECPLLEKPTDGRRKKLICAKNGTIKWRNSPACEEFYEGGFNEKHLSESCEGNGNQRVVNI